MSFMCGAICEKCGRVQAYSTVQGVVRLTKWLREDGWSVGKRNKEEYLLCPNCRSKKRGEKN